MYEIIHTENYKMVVEQCAHVTMFNISNSCHSLNILVNFTSYFYSGFQKRSLSPAPSHWQQREKLLQIEDVKVPINFGVIPTTLFTGICGGVKSYMATGKIGFSFFALWRSLKWGPTISPKSTTLTLIKEQKRDHNIWGWKSSSWLRQTQKYVGG